MIQERDGYDVSQWSNILPSSGRRSRRGVTVDSFATRWNTVDDNGKLAVTYYNKVGTGHRNGAAEKQQIRDALDVLSAYTGNCINFVEDTSCDSWMDVDCAPAMDNYVEITCAHEGNFDDGCWAGWN